MKQLLVGHVVRPGARALLTGTFLSSICSDVQDSKETLVLKGAALCGEGLHPHLFLNSCLQLVSVQFFDAVASQSSPVERIPRPGTGSCDGTRGLSSLNFFLPLDLASQQ